MRRHLPLLIALTLLASQGLSVARTEGSSVIEGLRAMYFATGFPVDGTQINSNTTDVKFQVSFALPLFRSIGGRDGLDLKAGYTQRSVWNLYAESSPFKDNMYIPGLYLTVPADNGSLLCGIEHRSNGRADVFSRSVNYLFGEYSRSFPFGLTLMANARFGVGWYNETLTQDIFSRFYGYATFGAIYETGRFTALACTTPSFGDNIFNNTVELSFNPGRKDNPLYHIFIQYHHGYDECMCDCVYGSKPGHNLRFGILITPHGSSRLSM